MRLSWFIPLMLLLGCGQTQEPDQYLQSEAVQLSAPVVVADSLVFRQQAKISVSTGHPDAAVRYTRSGAIVKADSPVLESGKVFTDAYTIKAKAFHPEFKSSEVVRLDLCKVGDLPWSIGEPTVPPAPQYSANGLQSLYDLSTGTLDHTQDWLGYNYPVVFIELEFEEAVSPQAISLGCLVKQDAWIFAPARLDVLVDSRNVGTSINQAYKKPETAQRQVHKITLDGTKSRKFTLQITTMSTLPDWHAGAGNQGWFFMDEIVVQ